MDEYEKPPKTNPRVRGSSPGVQVASRALRHALTPAEQRLWRALRGWQLGHLKFRRQHPLGRFILDFYCPAHHLVVELDGGIHEHQRERDDDRTRVLQEYGCRVLRFQNEQVMEQLGSVLASIVAAVSIP